ncbi:MFS transporter [Actinocorallia longicatena]|uniref:DHA2 family efflux MFS transporter permease subunit n=1 Tax=Actinocorallia longicatena TaxID=111803 RepID=A0ABP6QIV9_9ACTN
MKTSKWAALALLATTQFVLILDLTIVGIALPPMGRDLDLDSAGLSWMTTAYSLVFGGLLLLGGRLADTLGRRRVFVAGMAMFAAASLAGGAASTGEMVIAVRAVQGLAGALVAPAALSLVMTIFKDDPALARAMGIWGAVGGVGGAAGVVLGGVLTDAFGWRSVFFVNVPVGAAVAVLALVLLPEARSAAPRRGFDLAGAVTSTTGLGLLTYALVDAAESGWASGPVLAAAAAAVALLALFLVLESRSANPLMPLTIFRNPPLRAGNLLMFLVPAAMQPVFFLLTLYTQQILGYTPTESGLSIAAIAVAIALTASLAGGRAVERFGIRATAVAGLGLLLGGALLYLRLAVGGSFAGVLLAPEIITGVGFGLFVVAATVAATSGVSGEEAGLASGLVNVAQQTGISVGTALIVAVAAAVTGGSTRPADLVEGYHAGIGVAVAILAVGLVAAAVLLPRRPRVAEPALVPAA